MRTYLEPEAGDGVENGVGCWVDGQDEDNGPCVHFPRDPHSTHRQDTCVVSVKHIMYGILDVHDINHYYT